MEVLHQFFADTMNPLLAIAVALILGLLSTRVMKMVGLPNVTGYLIIGLIIGPYALGLISTEVNDNLRVVSTVALGFIGFSIGVEFKISHIKQIGKSAITITFCQALMATLCVDVLLICGDAPAEKVAAAVERLQRTGSVRAERTAPPDVKARRVMVLGEEAQTDA